MSTELEIVKEDNSGESTTGEQPDVGREPCRPRNPRNLRTMDVGTEENPENNQESRDKDPGEDWT